MLLGYHVHRHAVHHNSFPNQGAGLALDRLLSPGFPLDGGRCQVHWPITNQKLEGYRAAHQKTGGHVYLSKIGELPIKNIKNGGFSQFFWYQFGASLGRCLSNSCWEDFSNFRRRSGRANATAFVGRICCRSWRNSVAFKPSGPCVSHHILIGTALKTPTMP